MDTEVFQVKTRRLASLDRALSQVYLYRRPFFLLPLMSTISEFQRELNFCKSNHCVLITSTKRTVRHYCLLILLGFAGEKKPVYNIRCQLTYELGARASSGMSRLGCARAIYRDSIYRVYIWLWDVQNSIIFPA